MARQCAACCLDSATDPDDRHAGNVCWRLGDRGRSEQSWTADGTGVGVGEEVGVDIDTGMAGARVGEIKSVLGLVGARRAGDVAGAGGHLLEIDMLGDGTK